jgi:2-polyprenyl-3-methyl-5-hydroxy-6-metoxy-1,4-benzoquinol methylase
MTDTARRVADFFDRKARSFDAIYSGQKSALGRAWDRLTRRNIGQRFDFTLRALEPVAGKTVLDVGCGSGRYCVELARRGATDVVGIDLAPQMLSLARDLAAGAGVADRCRFVESDVASFTAAEPFDAVVAMGFFDYVDRPLDVLRGLRPLTRGLLVAAFPARLALRVPPRKLYLNLRGCPVYFYNAADVRRLAEGAGFTCVSLERRGPIYLLVGEPNDRP